MSRGWWMLLIMLLGWGLEASPRRAVQLDLARQPESVEFITNYLLRVSTAGANTVVLYLEDRVRTASYPYPKAEECYSPADISVVVAAERLGVDLVPVVSPLGHAERFLRHPELRQYAEEREGSGRWGRCDEPQVFCLENPRAREWMERYLGEVAALFPGRNFHFGFDETWNLGYCPDCRRIRERDGLGELYLRRVRWAHEVADRMGKRMWMWDDFFAFFPEKLEQLPKDIVMCCWNYCPDLDRAGVRDNFCGRRRHDALGEYARLGLEAVACCWYDIDNVRGLCDYTVRRPNGGQLITQWLMEREFHGYYFPRTLAALDLWQSPEHAVGDLWIGRGVAKAFPLADEATRDCVVALLSDPGLALWSAQPTLNGCLDYETPRSRLAGWRVLLSGLQRVARRLEDPVDPDPLSESALLDDLTVRTEMSLIALEARNAARRLLMPDRTAGESAAAKALICGMEKRWLALCGRREHQWACWRHGPISRPCRAYHDSYPKLVDKVRGIAPVAEDSEWLLELDLLSGDTYGVPRFSVGACVDGHWQEVASGSWKARSGDPAYFPKRIPLKLEGDPKALRIAYSGYGACELAYVSLRGKHRRLVPERIIKAVGEVRMAENLLRDDFRVAMFGNADGAAAVSHPELAEKVSMVELTVKGE